MLQLATLQYPLLTDHCFWSSNWLDISRLFGLLVGFIKTPIKCQTLDVPMLFGPLCITKLHITNSEATGEQLWKYQQFPLVTKMKYY